MPLRLALAGTSRPRRFGAFVVPAALTPRPASYWAPHARPAGKEGQEPDSLHDQRYGYHSDTDTHTGGASTSAHSDSKDRRRSSTGISPRFIMRCNQKRKVLRSYLPASPMSVQF